MSVLRHRSIARAAVAAAAAALAIGLNSIPMAASAQAVTVIVDGQTMSFDQPPIIQTGRVFVPLRGIFERLGASVVYSNGRINATGRGRTVSLTIGSTQATVDGQPTTLDVAPFVVGARTLVPLRFIAQSLGAAVDWNNGTSTVTINSRGGGGGGAPPPGPRPVALSYRYPTGTVYNHYPQLRFQLDRPVRLGTFQVLLDGRDVTSRVANNGRWFYLATPFSLPMGVHRVRVHGRTASGAPFDLTWSFTQASSYNQTPTPRFDHAPGAPQLRRGLGRGAPKTGSMRRALVTGASAGLAAGVAAALPAAGFGTVAITYRTTPPDETLRVIEAAGARPAAERVDFLDDATAIAASLDRLAAACGPFDTLVHGVGPLVLKRFERLTDDDYRAAFDGNVRSAVLATRAVLPAMREAKFGRIVFFAMLGSAQTTPFRGFAFYQAAKSALTAFARCLALEQAPSGITVNVVAPGDIRNKTLSREDAMQRPARNPRGRPGSYEDVADAVRFLVADARDFITGAVLEVTGGLTQADERNEPHP